MVLAPRKHDVNQCHWPPWAVKIVTLNCHFWVAMYRRAPFISRFVLLLTLVGWLALPLHASLMAVSGMLSGGEVATEQSVHHHQPADHSMHQSRLASPSVAHDHMDSAECEQLCALQLLTVAQTTDSTPAPALAVISLPLIPSLFEAEPEFPPPR